MSDFLSDLDFYCTEHLPPTKDPEYEALCLRHQELDAKIVQALGREFLEEYGLLFYQIMGWELLDHFREGLRFGARFMHEILA